MRSSEPARRRASIVLVLGLLASSTPLASASAQGVDPSLRLVRSRSNISLKTYRDRVPLDLGMWVASAGGDFEVHVGMEDYGDPLTAAQVDSTTKAPLRTIPAEDLNGWQGFNDFLRVRVRNQAGRIVADKTLNFCPNSYDRERVDDSGDAVSTYPAQECRTYFPFTRGTVWGIDQGWATSAFSGVSYRASSAALRPGEYTATMRLAQHYVDLFDVAPGDEKRTVNLEVLAGGSGGSAHPDAFFAGESAEQEAGESAEQETASAGDAPIVTTPDPATLPDLAALPAWNIRVRNGARDFLSFAATPWNEGPSPLVVEGFRGSEDDEMDAFQYFYDSTGTAVGRAPVGTFDYDTRNGHHHWHFLQFARYRLLVADDRTEVVRSRKQSFCIAPTDAVDLTVPGASLDQYGLGFGSWCGHPTSIWVREVLQPGWGDTYFQSVAGQAFDITNVPNGRYLLETSVNPGEDLFDGDASNDVEVRRVRLSGPPDERRVEVSAWHGIED